MPTSSKSRAKKVGQAPGILVYVGEKKTDKVRITLVDFNQEGDYKVRSNATFKDLQVGKDPSSVTWITVSGVHETELIGEIGRYFNLHPLIIEDILNTDQRPRLEVYEDFIFVVLKMLRWEAESNTVDSEQITLLVSPNFVLSFEENEDDTFNPLRQRLNDEQGRLRTWGSDYLAYAIIDTIVDNYFLVLEQLSDEIEALEEEVISNPTPNTLDTIKDLKREFLYLRKVVWPLRDALSHLSRGDIPIFQEETLIYLRDVYEHIIQIIDTIETYRSIASGLLDIYLSSVGNKMNEIMKVLTIIATIFIPITFLTSIYGMELPNMPERQWSFTYPLLWLIIFIISAALLIYFKRKDWL